MITQELIYRLFEYKDGNLYWKMCGKRTDLIGTKAGTLNGDRWQVTIDKKHYKLHRLIFMMFHGFMPDEIDHIDNNPLNNRIENLRPASRSEQCCNTSLRIDSTSGIKGVTWDKARNKWIVSINKNKKTVFRGRFDNLELAHLVSLEARNKYHGDYAKCQ